MSELFDDDDLFAVRPVERKARPQPKPKPEPICQPAPSAFIGPRWPTGSFACPCGAQEEIREPAPDRLDCWGCHRPETMVRIVPRYLPPQQAGRFLTPHELEGLRLDALRRR